MRGGQLPRNFGKSFRAPCDEDEVVAAAGQFPAKLHADSVRGSGDQSPFVLHFCCLPEHTEICFALSLKNS
jgi:hypothetical protein